MSTKFDDHNGMESGRHEEIKAAALSDAEFDRVKAVFDAMEEPSFKMSDEDMTKLGELLPDLDLSLVKDCEVKCPGGQCECGRKLTLFDIVSASLSQGVHTVKFLERLLEGTMGRLVICAAGVDEEMKSKLPPNTIFVKDTSLIPCTNCGKGHALTLIQMNVLHYWIQ